jgi:hypothetical protein
MYGREELNTIKHEAGDEIIPGPLVELLIRILRRSKPNQGNHSAQNHQENLQQSHLVKQ